MTTDHNSKAKHWSFAWNNCTEEDVPTELPEGATHLVAGREVSGTGTKHLQGAV